MVTDTKGDTGFVIPIRAAERLSNIRFRLLPEVFDGWTDLRNERDALSSQVNNLQQQADEASGIAERRKQEVELCRGQLDETEKILKRKNFGLKFYRVAAVVFAISTATLVLTR